MSFCIGHNVGVLCVPDFGLFGRDVGLRERKAELLGGGGACSVGIVDIGHRGLKIGVERLNDGVGLKALGIMLFMSASCLRVSSGSVSIYSIARHVIIGGGVLPRSAILMFSNLSASLSFPMPGVR